MLVKYDLKMPHAVFSGEDALDKIRDIIAENHVKHLAVFTDKGIRGAGLLDLPMARVEETGVDTVILDDLPAEPSYEEAQKLGAAPNPVGAESKYEMVPMVYRVSGTFRKADPTLERRMIRINPMRAGADTILEIIKKAVERVK